MVCAYEPPWVPEHLGFLELCILPHLEDLLIRINVSLARAQMAKLVFHRNYLIMTKSPQELVWPCVEYVPLLYTA